MAHHFAVHWQRLPYWTAYLIIAAGDAIAGPFFAAKLITGVCVLLVPLSTMRLVQGVATDPVAAAPNSTSHVATVVHDAGVWRLYKITARPPS